jgi:hypothetical protein
MAHGQKLHTFCVLAWPRKSIWNRDIDKSADPEVLQTLSEKTATAIERVRFTTLAAYGGVLYEKHNHFGPTAWIMPVGVYHRTHRQFGLQYCSLCLAEDKEPYYRRRWRLAFMVLCEKHHTLLHDRCPRCGEAVNFHRNELGDPHKFAPESLTQCYTCDFDLRFAHRENNTPTVSLAEVEFTTKLLQAMDEGYVRVSETEVVYSHLYFTVLRHLMRVMAMKNKRLEQLRRTLSELYKVEAYTPPAERRPPDVQEQGLSQRRQLLQAAYCLLAEWPHRFIFLAQKHKVWSSLWLRHLEGCPWERSQIAPFWFWRVIHDHLYRARYCPSDEEMLEAIKYLRRKGGPQNKSALSRLLGVAVVRREIAM